MRRRSRCLASFAALCLVSFVLSGCSSQSSGDAPGAVDAARDATDIVVVGLAPAWSDGGRAFSRRALGHNAVWSRGGLGLWDEATGAPRPDVLSLVKAVSPGVLRFPGGTRAMRYHFDEAIGPKAARKPQCDPFKGTTDGTTYGLDEALPLAAEVGAEVTLVAPWVDGTPQEAAALVAYVNADASSTVPIGVDDNGKDWGNAGRWGAQRASNGHAASWAVGFLEIGNEPYLELRAGPIAGSCGRATQFKQDERWVKGVAIPTTAQDHAAQVKKTGDLVHAVDPAMKIGASAYSSFDGVSDAAKEIGELDRKMGSSDAWNARLVEGAGDSFDFFVLHPYDFSGKDSRLQLGERLRKTVHDLRRLAPGKAIAVTEFGFLLGGDTLMNAVVAADFVRIATEEQLLMSLRHILIEDDETGPFASSAAILGPEHATQPGFHVMKQLASTLQTTSVPVATSIPDVTAFATRDAAGVTLAIVLLDRRADTGDEKPVAFDVALPEGRYVGSTWTLAGESPVAVGTDVKTSEQPLAAEHTARVVVPLHGVAIVSLKKTD
ncbi:MAG: hypothetical protein ABI175_05970 [Polyangiales bacterium]